MRRDEHHFNHPKTGVLNQEREEMEERADVVIVGAGIAGIALSFELQKRSVSTLLLDRRKSPDPTPRGITLQPNGLEALEKIGILDRVQQLGTPERILEIKDWDHNLLLEADYSALDHPHNYIMTVDAVEVEQVLGYKTENMGAKTIWGAGFEEILWNNGTAQGVRVSIEGEQANIRASMVVGADGPQSKVRTSIGAVAKTRKYSDSFLVGLVGPTRELKDRARQYQAPGKMLGIMPAGPDASYFFYCVGERGFNDLKRQGVEQFRGEVTEAAPEMEEAFESVEAWTRMAYFKPSFIKVDPWVGNGVALLGDSAHTFHPHSGQGVNLSLQDALTLADVISEALKAGDTSVAKLSSYQASRKMYADVIGQHAHYTATYALSKNWLVKRLNKRALRKMQKNRKLMKRALEITAGIFTKKPGLIEQAKIGGILP
jgi:2-polyprenyl-6-methoxyphenol hydroxylase-like FAD-dependent oxidoreductase